MVVALEVALVNAKCSDGLVGVLKRSGLGSMVPGLTCLEKVEGVAADRAGGRDFAYPYEQQPYAFAQTTSLEYLDGMF